MAFFSRIRSSSSGADASSSSAPPANASSLGGHLWRTDTLERKTHSPRSPTATSPAPSSSSVADEQKAASNDGSAIASSSRGDSSAQGMDPGPLRRARAAAGSAGNLRLTPDKTLQQQQQQQYTVLCTPSTPPAGGQNSPKLRPQRFGFGQGPLKASHDIIPSPALGDLVANGHRTSTSSTTSTASTSTNSSTAPKAENGGVAVSAGYPSPRSLSTRSVPVTPVKAQPPLPPTATAGQSSSSAQGTPVLGRNRRQVSSQIPVQHVRTHAEQAHLSAAEDDTCLAYSPGRRDSTLSETSYGGGGGGVGGMETPPSNRRRSSNRLSAGQELAAADSTPASLVHQHHFLSMNDLDVVSPMGARGEYCFTPGEKTPVMQTPELPTMSDGPSSMPTGPRGKRIKSMLKTFSIRKTVSSEAIDVTAHQRHHFSPLHQKAPTAAAGAYLTPGSGVGSPFSDGEKISPYKKLNKSWKRLLPNTKKKLFPDTPTVAVEAPTNSPTPPGPQLAVKTPLGRTVSHNMPLSYNRGVEPSTSSPTNSSASSPTPTNSPVMQRRAARPPPPNRSGAMMASPKVTPLPMSPMRPRRPETIEDMFCAIETQDIYQVEELLRNPMLDLSQTNAEDHTALDVAVMTNAVSIAKLLMSRGAMENQMYLRNRYVRSVRLTTLLNESLEQVEALSHALRGMGAPSANTTTLYSSPKLKDLEDELHTQEHKCQILKQMLETYDNAKPPSAPSRVTLSVYSPSALRVDFDEPTQSNGAVVTRYKVQWSENSTMTGSKVVVVTDLREMRHIIDELTEGVPYFVSVHAFNMQGYGPPQSATPASAVPSGWKSAMDDVVVSDRLGAAPQCKTALSALASTLLQATSTESSESKGVRKNWFKLFGARFTHTLQPRCLYMGVALITNNNRLLVTMDGHLPILPVDDGTVYRASQSSQDILWFLKVACSWQGVHQLKEVLSSACNVTNSVSLRSKLLSTVLQAQLSIGQMQVGQLHHQVFSDTAGATVILAVQEVKKSQSVSASMRWISLSRFLQKRGLPEDHPSDDLCVLPIGSATQGQAVVRAPASPGPRSGALRHVNVFNFSPPTPLYSHIVTALPKLVEFHRNSTSLPQRGLYVALLALRTTISNMAVYVSKSYPAMLPHVKVSDNPNVSKDEWWWIQVLQHEKQWDVMQEPSLDAAIAQGRSFQQRIARAASRLYGMYASSTEDAEFLTSYNLYTREVIEVSPDISYLLVIPCAQDMVLAPDQEHCLDGSSDILHLPLHYYELMCRNVYLPSVMPQISRLAAMSDVRSVLGQQKLREAFSKEEVIAAQAESEKQSSSATELDTVWRDLRWINDLLEIGRDPNCQVRVSLRSLYSNPVASSCNSLQRVGRTSSAERRSLGASPLQYASYRASQSSPRHPLHDDGSSSDRSSTDSKTPTAYRHTQMYGPLAPKPPHTNPEGTEKSLTTWMSVVMDANGGSDDSGFPVSTTRANPSGPSSESDSTDEQTAPSSPTISSPPYKPSQLSASSSTATISSTSLSPSSSQSSRLSGRTERPSSGGKQYQPHVVFERLPKSRSGERLNPSPTSRFARLTKLRRSTSGEDTTRLSPMDRSPRSSSPPSSPVDGQLSDRRKGPKLKLANLSRSPILGKRLLLSKTPSSPLLTYMAKDPKTATKATLSTTKSATTLDMFTSVNSPKSLTLIHPSDTTPNQKMFDNSLDNHYQQQLCPSFVRVYSSHDTALSSTNGQEVQATLTTSAGEIIYDLVRQQLLRHRRRANNQRNSGSPTRRRAEQQQQQRLLALPAHFYDNQELVPTVDDVLDDFCLVAIVNSHPKLLPDAYCPLQLSSSWTREHLYMRERSIVEKSLRRQKSTSV